MTPIQKRRKPRLEAIAGITALLVLLTGCQPQEQPQDGGRSAPKGKPVTPPATQEIVPPPPATVQEKAGVGAGEKGRGYGGGLVTTPVAAYFAARERVAFDIQIPHALDLYKAAEGHAPKTHEEFMRDIVEANQIRLPTLPAGHRYVYDPKSEQLMVEHPQQ